MYVKKSVPRPAGSPGIGLQIRDQLTLIDVDDVLYMPAPDSKGVMIAENIVMKPGTYPINIYMTPGTVEVTSAADGDTDKVGFTPSVKFEHPGNEQEVREFKANNINRKFIIVVRYCSGKAADLIGSLCNPCKFSPSYTGNGESNTNEMTFTQISKGSDIFMYSGTVPTEEPIPAEVTDGVLAVVADGQILLGADAVTGLNAPGGLVVTLLGAEGAAPVQSADTIKLLNGETFPATPGTQLTLRSFNAGSEVLWFEQSRFVG